MKQSVTINGHHTSVSIEGAFWKALKEIEVAQNITAIRPRVLVGEGRVAIVTCQRVESKRVDEFANMSDEELKQYVYGKKELHS